MADAMVLKTIEVTRTGSNPVSDTNSNMSNSILVMVAQEFMDEFSAIICRIL